MSPPVESNCLPCGCRVVVDGFGIMHAYPCRDPQHEEVLTRAAEKLAADLALPYEEVFDR